MAGDGEQVGQGLELQLLDGGVLPLADLVDFEKELARIAKEKANAEKQLAGIENKLKNEGFLAKAPEAVVNGARADAEKLKALIEKLDASAAAMKK